MSLKRDLLVSLGLQGVGAAAVLLATLALGARLGPEVQGEFSHIKAEVEFVSAVAMFGLPQALFFYAKSGQLTQRNALRWVLGCTLVALPLAAVWAAWHLQTVAVVVLFAVSVGAIVAHGLIRALLLVSSRTVWFNVLTALPLVLVLVGALGVIASGAADAAIWLMIFGLTYAFAALVAWRCFARLTTGGVETNVGWRALAHYGMAAWLTAVLVTAAILFMQRWVEVEVGPAALGHFTMAMTLVQVPLTPISYAAPLLLRHWMERPGAAASRRIAGAVCALMLMMATIAWSATLVSPELGLGPAYVGVTGLLAILLVGGAGEAGARVLAVQAGASGTPWVGVRAEVARYAVLIGGGVVLPAPSLPVMCAVWAAGAWVAAGVYAWLLRPRAAELVA